jgi:hypothetical protein
MMKNYHDYEREGIHNDFNCNSFLMGNNNQLIFNSNSNFTPIGDFGYFNSMRMKKKQVSSNKDNVNLLKYLDSDTKKELKERDELKINLLKR